MALLTGFQCAEFDELQIFTSNSNCRKLLVFADKRPLKTFCKDNFEAKALLCVN